jgi:hypothetical protein
VGAELAEPGLGGRTWPSEWAGFWSASLHAASLSGVGLSQGRLPVRCEVPLSSLPSFHVCPRPGMALGVFFLPRRQSNTKRNTWYQQSMPNGVNQSAFSLRVGPGACFENAGVRSCPCRRSPSTQLKRSQALIRQAVTSSTLPPASSAHSEHLTGTPVALSGRLASCSSTQEGANISSDH